MNKCKITVVGSAMEKSVVRVEHCLGEFRLVREVSQGFLHKNKPLCEDLD